MSAIAEGNAEVVGQLMSQYQREFDEVLVGDLWDAPKMREVLAYEGINGLYWGGKGIGSHGDGSVQLLAKGKPEQTQIMEVLQRSDLNVECIPLTVPARR